jgi:hypothetical protein
MKRDITSSSENEIICWVVTFNSVGKLLEMHYSCSLAAFKEQVRESYGLNDEDILRL